MSKSQQFEDSLNNPLYSLIGRRIILILILLSGAFTLFMSLMQFYWDYKAEFSAVDQRHSEVSNIHAPLLATSLWNFDLVLLQERLDGLVHLPHVQYLEVKSENYRFHSGATVNGEKVSSEFSLVTQDPVTGSEEKVGTLYVESNADEIYLYLLKQFFLTLLLNAIKTTIVCALILVVFHESINRRIFKIAKYLREFNPRHPAKPLEFEHNRWLMEKGDELDWLGDETNRISANVSLLYNGIKQEQDRLSDFAHVSSDWLWETDENGRLMYCSESMADSLDIDVFQHPFMSKVESFKYSTPLIQSLDSRRSFSQVEVDILIGGAETHKLFQGHARYDENTFLGFRGSAIDITELKHSQLQLESLNRDLERKVTLRTLDLNEKIEQLTRAQAQLIESEKLAALGGLVAGVAHEVNTPLGIAVTAGSVVKESLFELEKQFSNESLTTELFERHLGTMQQSVDMLESNLNRAAKLVRDFKQTAVDQVSEAQCDFNVRQVLCSLIASLHPETRKIPVTPELTGDPSVSICSLPGVLTQVISNLILNSVNHAFENTSAPSIHISYRLSGHTLILEYKDNGAGVAKENQKAIFEPFYTTKRGKGGSGLGLNLVFNLTTQKLNGELSFDSLEGHGVHFVLKLPVKLACG